jgi:AcrR family transcriptional regulator
MSTPSVEQRLSLRERKKVKTRRTIREHALRLFSEQGYNATTIEQIADASEVSPSTFFRYFPTKEDVVISDEYDPVMAAAYLAQPAELPPIEALRRASIEALSEMPEPEYERLVARTRLVNETPALRARQHTEMEKTYGWIGEATARRLGRPADDQEVRIFAHTVMGAMVAAGTMWRENPRERTLVDAVDRALTFLAAGFPFGDS